MRKSRQYIILKRSAHGSFRRSEDRKVTQHIDAIGTVLISPQTASIQSERPN